jgi:hypothetical protein
VPVRALAALLLFAACGGAPADEPACRADEDCPPGLRCAAATGVCVGFRTPLDAAVPDLAAGDLSGDDLSGDDPSLDGAPGD